jgi:hypothetical protein
MRVAFVVLASVAAFGALAANPKPKLAMTATPAASPQIERFLLQANGVEASCTIEKALGADRLSHVMLAPACNDVLPGLSALHYWAERSDGTVALSADGRTAIIVLAQGDGVAYEAIEPEAPVIALIASD